MIAPRQPRKPVTMITVPMAMTRLAAESDGKLGENVAKFPCDTDSQMPTPSRPQPHNCRDKQKKGFTINRSVIVSFPQNSEKKEFHKQVLR